MNYVIWNPRKQPVCPNPAAAYRIYCHPKYYSGLPNILYRNNGDGTFTDVSRSSGIADHIGKGMGVAFADYNHDGYMDVFVANDTVPNFLFRNDGDGRFTQVGFETMTALTSDGRRLSFMGVDFRDYDNDGREDVFLTALATETFPLFRNLGGSEFDEVTFPSGLGSLTMAHSGWGNGIFDFNNDGFKDLFIANGDVQDNTEVYSSGRSRQENLILLNRGDGKFVDLSEQPGKHLQQLGLHRGAAFGDLDGDGRVDVVVTRLNERAVIFRNTTPTDHHWLALRLVGRQSNRDAIGARIRLVDDQGREQFNHVTTSVGYASSSSRVVHFGLGRSSSVRRIEISWPSGIRQIIDNVPVDRTLDIPEAESPEGVAKGPKGRQEIATGANPWQTL